MDAKDKEKFFGIDKKESPDMATLCVCGCPMGVHYFMIIPGSPMCSTCTTCRLFVPASPKAFPAKDVAHV